MNVPCRIHFHGDSAPKPYQLPQRYRDSLNVTVHQGEESVSLDVGHAFYVNFWPSIVRTRVGGTKGEDPVDFQSAGISHIEWFYGDTDRKGKD